MVVMVQGSYVSSNEATAIASAIAVSSAINSTHKTLVMQLTDNKSLSALSVLKGKEIAENTITELGTYQIEDKGIDALLRRAGSVKLVKETFDSSTEPMLSYENYLDVADITKKNDFIKTLSVSAMKNILKYANDVYGMIIIILDGKNDQIMAEMLSLCDAYITCVKQGPSPHAYNTAEGKKQYFAVSEFDTQSRYNLQYLKKIYNNNNVYAIPYNTEFHDAVISGTLLRFMLKNNAPEKEDDNSKLRESIIDLAEAVIGDKQAADRKALEKFEDESFIRDDEKEGNELTEVSDFEYQTVETEKRHFLKKVIETEEVLHIGDTEDKKQTRFAIFKKKKTRRDFIEPEDKLLPQNPFDEDTYEADSTMTEKNEPSVLEEEEISEEKPKKLKKEKREKRGLFGRKKKRVSAEEYAFLDYEENVVKEISEEDEEIPDEKHILNYDELTKKTKQYHKEEKAVVEEYETDVLGATSIRYPHDTWICSSCGTENTGKFCNECGAARIIKWACTCCGTVNTGKFCNECGTKRGA